MNTFWAREHKMKIVLHDQDWKKCNSLTCLTNLLVRWQDSHVTHPSHVAEVQVLGMVWGISQGACGWIWWRRLEVRLLPMKHSFQKSPVQHQHFYSWSSENSTLNSPLSGREAVELHCEHMRLWHSSVCLDELAWLKRWSKSTLGGTQRIDQAERDGENCREVLFSN